MNTFLVTKHDLGHHSFNSFWSFLIRNSSLACLKCNESLSLPDVCLKIKCLKSKALLAFFSPSGSLHFTPFKRNVKLNWRGLHLLV